MNQSAINYINGNDWNGLKGWIEGGNSIETIIDPSRQRTSLLYAALHDKSNIVKELLTLGANIEAVDDVLDTPLILAVWTRSYDTVKILLEAGANPFAWKPNENLDLITVIRRHAMNLQIASLIREYQGKYYRKLVQLGEFKPAVSVV